MRFKLLVGQHIQADKSQKPDANGKYPSKTYTAGTGNNIVESDIDLVEKFGHEKFQLIGASRAKKPVTTGNPTPGDPTPQNLVNNPDRVMSEEGVPVNNNPPDTINEEEADEDEIDEDAKSQRAQASTKNRTMHSPPSSKVTVDKQKLDMIKKIDHMNATELKNLADEEEIDLKGATKKEDMAKVIKHELFS